MGYPIRFDLKQLPDPVCGEMHLLIGRISEMPKISGIAANHNDKFGSIFLYEYVLVDLSDDSVLEIRKFNTYLTNRRTIYRGMPWTGDKDDEEADYYPE